jgi:hypothetical protein
MAALAKKTLNLTTSKVQIMVMKPPLEVFFLLFLRKSGRGGSCRRCPSGEHQGESDKEGKRSLTNYRFVSSNIESVSEAPTAGGGCSACRYEGGSVTSWIGGEDRVGMCLMWVLEVNR